MINDMNISTDMAGVVWDADTSSYGVAKSYGLLIESHTPQTGDSFARLGAPAGASVSADIADLPTVAEFEARTLVAAGYAPAATALSSVQWTAARAAKLDWLTGDAFARLGAPAGASVSADALAIKGVVDAILAAMGAGGDATLANQTTILSEIRIVKKIVGGGR